MNCHPERKGPQTLLSLGVVSRRICICPFAILYTKFRDRTLATIEDTMIEYLYLGRVDYAEGLRLQAEIAELVTAGRLSNMLLLLEHPAVLTLGRNGNRANVLASDELLAARGVQLHEINRGGDVTYHGPGQLVGDPIFDLRSLRGPGGGRMGPVDFVRGMEEALIRVCLSYGVRAGRVAGLTGVWCGVRGSGIREQGSAAQGQGTEGSNSEKNGSGHASLNAGQNGSVSGHDLSRAETAAKKSPALAAVERKIGAIGIHVSKGITSHGFAFNVTTDLRDFELIVPCGIADHAVTSLDHEIASPPAVPALEAVAHEAARQFGRVFDQQVLAVDSLAGLRSHAQPAREFPAEDTPLQIPPELEQLRGAGERPLRA